MTDDGNVEITVAICGNRKSGRGTSAPLIGYHRVPFHENRNATEAARRCRKWSRLSNSISDPAQQPATRLSGIDLASDRRRGVEWGHGGTAAGSIRSTPLMRVYIIGNDGITL